MPTKAHKSNPIYTLHIKLNGTTSFPEQKLLQSIKQLASVLNSMKYGIILYFTGIKLITDMVGMTAI